MSSSLSITENDSDSTSAESMGLTLRGEGNQGVDVELFTKFYLATRASLRGYLGTMLHSEAACEDCMQEAILVVWDKCRDDWQIEDFRKVAFTAARFKALSWLKKHKPARHLNLSPELSEKLSQKAAELSSAPVDHQIDRIQALRLCIEALPEGQRELVKVRYEESNPEALAAIAEKQNRNMNAVYKQLERIRTALRKCVERKVEP